MAELSEHIEVSPVPVEDEAPERALHELLLEKLTEHITKSADKPWVVDTATGMSVKFRDVEPWSRRIASALRRMGVLDRGQTLFYVTYEMSQLYVVWLAAWRLGAGVRGCFQGEPPAEFARQLRETDSRVILVDSETAERVREACADLEWPVKLVNLSSEHVKGTIPLAELLQDDGSECPERVEVTPREDVVFIPNTSGSTGLPKGVLYTHHTVSCLIHIMSKSIFPSGQVLLSVGANYVVSNFVQVLSSLMTGGSFHTVPRFLKEDFIQQIFKYKPMGMTLYPYVATWFARTPDLEGRDLSFVKFLFLGGSVLDATTSKLLRNRLPTTFIAQGYALTECPSISMSSVGVDPAKMMEIRTKEFEGEICVTTGKLGPTVTAKIIDSESGASLGRMKSGELLVKAPHVMKGYMQAHGKPPDRRAIDADGWLHTGDLAFFDEEGFLYIRERKSFMFKYFMHFVSPTELENVLSEHPAVQEVGVVGVPNEETTNLARACVVLKPGHSACAQTAAQLVAHVAARLPEHLHLHGGVRFLTHLPQNRGSKLDRAALREMAISAPEPQAAESAGGQGAGKEKEGIVDSLIPSESSEVPLVPFADYLMESLSEVPADKPWVFDVLTGVSVKFGEVESMSRRVGSALRRLGVLDRGQTLFYVTYEMAHLYVALMAAWRIGASTRGCYQGETTQEVARQIRETGSRVVLVDSETAPLVREAISSLTFPVKLVSFGSEVIPGATSFSELLQDDGSEFPEHVAINPREDVVYMCNTSGSTGMPKGVMHTHFSAVACFYNLKKLAPEEDKVGEAGSHLIMSPNYVMSNFYNAASSLRRGGTLYLISKFSKDTFFQQLTTHKPSSMMLYPYIATWFSRTGQAKDLTFLKYVMMAGSVLDHTTARLLRESLPPTTLIVQLYACTECCGISISTIGASSMEELMTTTTCEFEGQTRVSSGKIMPAVSAKIIDPESGATLGRMKSGELLVRAPYLMKGYLRENQEPDMSAVDPEGWLHTGDLGFFDHKDNLYILERRSFVFKYFMHFVSPAVLENVLSEHPAVQEVGVVGIPSRETTNLARACVVLRPGHDACAQTAAHLVAHVAARLPEHLHLHGGVRFLTHLPENRGGKLDRAALREMAIATSEPQATEPQREEALRAPRVQLEPLTAESQREEAIRAAPEVEVKPAPQNEPEVKPVEPEKSAVVSAETPKPPANNETPVKQKAAAAKSNESSCCVLL